MEPAKKTDASSWVKRLRALGVREGVDLTQDVLARWRSRGGSETSKKQALCEAMIQTEDEWEYDHVSPKRRALLKSVRYELECELYP